MKYLASLYSLNAKSNSFQDTCTRKHRYEYTMKRTCELLKKGEVVFSPIVHMHEMSIKYNLPKDYSFFKKIDRAMIDKADSLIVLKMKGWEQSEGITDEIEYAKSLGKDIEYLECEGFVEVYDTTETTQVLQEPEVGNIVFQAVREQLGIDKIRSTDSLISLGADGLDTMEVVMQIEEELEYEIDIDDWSVSEDTTVEGLIKIVEDLL